MSLTDACKHEWLTMERGNTLALLPTPPPSPFHPIPPLTRVSNPPTQKHPPFDKALTRSVVSHNNYMALEVKGKENDATMNTARMVPPSIPSPREDEPSQPQSTWQTIGPQVIRCGEAVDSARDCGAALLRPFQEMPAGGVIRDEGEHNENPHIRTAGDNMANGCLNNEHRMALENKPAEAVTPHVGSQARKKKRGLVLKQRQRRLLRRVDLL